MGSLSQVRLKEEEQEQQGSSANSSATSGNRVILGVRDVCVGFRQRNGFFGEQIFINAVDHVSFELKESELVSLVGESGSGKTTLARCIMGLCRPQSGSIEYNGMNVLSLGRSALRKYWREVQLTFQDPFESLNPRQNVLTVIGASLRRLTDEKNQERITQEAARLLEEVELDPEVMYKLPHQLSGGERQRVSIARALAPKPKLLIADEPVTMLDASLRLNILDLLMELKAKRNLTILLITHDLASAKVMSDRTMIMYQGRLVEIGPTEIILSKPHHPYVEMILDATPRIGGKLDLTDEKFTSFKFRELESVGCNFRPRCKYASERCAEVQPELVKLSDNRLAACYNPLNTDSPKN